MEANNKEIKRRSTFAVLFYINRTKVRKDGLCQLLCKVSIDAESAQIGIRAAVDPAVWNPQTGRADGRSRNALEVNRAIDDLTVQIKDHYKRIKESLGFVTAELVKNAVKGIGQKPLTLLALFEDHNAEFHKRVGVDRTDETYGSYVRSYNRLRKFVQNKLGREDVTLRSLDMNFYDAYDLYLRSECGMQQKTVHERLYHLKKMTVRAVNQGTLRCAPYGKQHPALPPRRSRHLKAEDLEKLLARQTDDPNLQRVRDWFIFSTFTGLAYADLKRLSEKHITQDADGTQWIRIQRKKTDTLSVIRLLEVPRRIIEKYRSERTGERLLPICSYDKLQRLIPKLGTEYGINDMTFHKARHNFGTHITLSMGVPLETVSRMMGHMSVTTTQIYAHITDKKVDEDMKRLKTRTAGKKITLYENEALQTINR